MYKPKLNIMKTITKLSLLFMFTFAILSCTKEGPAGPAGADGKDGNANVHSIEITIYSNEWVAMNGGYGSGKTINEITQNIIDNGTVLAYVKGQDNNTTFYFALPFGNFTYAYSTNNIMFLDYNNNPPSGAMVFKVVIIDGVPPSSVNIQDYNSIADYYELN